MDARIGAMETREGTYGNTYEHLKGDLGKAMQFVSHSSEALTGRLDMMETRMNGISEALSQNMGDIHGRGVGYEKMASQSKEEISRLSGTVHDLVRSFENLTTRVARMETSHSLQSSEWSGEIVTLTAHVQFWESQVQSCQEKLKSHLETCDLQYAQRMQGTPPRAVVIGRS